MSQTQLQSKASLGITSYLSVGDFKSATLLDLSDYTDATLQKYLDRAQSMADVWLGLNIGYSSFCDKDIRCMYDYPNNGLAIQLPRRPIDKISKITVTFGTSYTKTWDTTSEIANWRINNAVGYIEYFGLSLSEHTLNVCLGDPLASNIIPMAEITHYSGYKTIPTSVAKAMVILMEQLIRVTQGDDIEITSIMEGNYREGYRRSKGIKSLGVVGGVDQVEQLLRPYRQPNQTLFTNGPFG